jgi:hypothetical protein
MKWSAELENKISPSAREAAEDLRALRSEIGGLRTDLEQLAATRASLGGDAPAGAPKAKPPSQDAPKAPAPGGGAPGKLQGVSGLSGAFALEEARKGAEAVEKAEEKKRKALEKTYSEGKAKLGKAAIVGGLIGAMVGSMAPLALGYQGMARMQAITYRASLDARALFKGVDAAPAIRAAERFEKNLSKSTVTGNALSGVLTRGFNGFFSGIEKAEPYFTAMAQGALIAGLYVEQGFLRARLAAYPLTSALGDVIGQEDALEVASVAGGMALVALGGYAAVATAPFLPLAAAITAVSAAIQQIVKLTGEWDGNSVRQIGDQMRRDLGFETEDQQVARKAERSTTDYFPASPAKVAFRGEPLEATGQVAGGRLGEGLVAGMDATAADVKAAGGRLADAADAGVREKAQIKSPSRRMKTDGRYMGAGVEEGLDESAPGIQRAADRSLVPDVGGRGAGAPTLQLGGMGGGPVTIGAITIAPVFPGVTSGNPADIARALLEVAPQLGQLIFRDIARQLAVPTGPT